MAYIVCRPFRTRVGMLVAGSLINPEDLRDFKVRLQDKHIREVTEDNFEEIASYLYIKFRVVLEGYQEVLDKQAEIAAQEKARLEELRAAEAAKEKIDNAIKASEEAKRLAEEKINEANAAIAAAEDAKIAADNAAKHAEEICGVANDLVQEAENAEKAIEEAKNTEAPVTEAPVTETSVTEVLVTEAPVTEAPVTEAPVTETSVTEVPVTEVPVTEVPVPETQEQLKKTEEAESIKRAPAKAVAKAKAKS